MLPSDAESDPEYVGLALPWLPKFLYILFASVKRKFNPAATQERSHEKTFGLSPVCQFKSRGELPLCGKSVESKRVRLQGGTRKNTPPCVFLQMSLKLKKNIFSVLCRPYSHA